MCLVVQCCDIAVVDIFGVLKLVMTDKRMKHLWPEVFVPHKAATGSAPASGGAARGKDTEMVDSEPGALAPSSADGSLFAAPPATDAASPADVFRRRQRSSYVIRCRRSASARHRCSLS